MKPQKILLVHRCFNNGCIQSTSSPFNLRRHLEDSHGYVFPAPMKTTRRYNTSEYQFLRHHSDNDDMEKHYACPCCIVHVKELRDLENHFINQHEYYHPSISLENSRSKSPAPEDTLSEHAFSDNTSSEQIIYSQPQEKKRSNKNAMLLDDIPIDQPRGEHLSIDGFDVTDANYRMKLALKDHQWKLSLEDHLYQVLAATSVLLLTPHTYPSEVQPYFTHEKWTAASNAIENIYKIQQQPLQIGTVASLLSIIDDLMRLKLDRDAAEIKLRTLKLPKNEKKFAKAVATFVNKLPSVPLDEDINECELCSGFIDPFLSGLFDDPNEGVYLRWTNESTLEAKEQSNNMRPVLSITKTIGLKFARSLGYGEAKPSARESDHYLVCKDFIKVVLFCKTSLHEQLMEGVLEIHIVGRTIRFYVLVLPATATYVMYLLAEIKVPDSIQGLPGFITELPSVLKILHAFNTICVCSVTPEVIAGRRAPTLPSKAFQQIISESKSRKRSCHLHRRHN